MITSETTLKKISTPYELLVRWNDQGELAGAHIRRLVRIVDEKGELHSTTEGPPEPFLVDAGSGFALDRLMSDATAAALRRAADLEIELANAEAAIEQEKAKLATALLKVNQMAEKLQRADRDLREVQERLAATSDTAPLAKADG